MKKQLLIWSLIATSGLCAEGSNQLSASCATQCIDCECYTPQYYDLQCACGYLIDVEFLYWYGKENNLSTALKVLSKGISEATPSSSASTGIIVPKELTDTQSRWKPGFRVGLGYQIPCDGWDVYVNYTYYHNKNKQRSSIELLTNAPPPLNEKGLLSQWANPFIDNILTNTLVAFQNIGTKWRLNYHMFDGELGRKYWLSQCFNLRPFFGLRGGWTRTDYGVDQELVLEEGVKTFIKVDDDFRNIFWGVGLLGGIQPAWHYNSCLSLYGLVDFALLWGDFDTRRKEKFSYQVNRSFPVVNGSYKSNNDFDGMQGIFDLGIGIRWEETWCCDRMRTTLDIGWEHHILYNHVTRLQLCDSYYNNNFQDSILGFTDYNQDETDLVFGGLVIRARFEF